LFDAGGATIALKRRACGNSRPGKKKKIKKEKLEQQKKFELSSDKKFESASLTGSCVKNERNKSRRKSFGRKQQTAFRFRKEGFTT
jgi:hypothetical protein